MILTMKKIYLYRLMFLAMLPALVLTSCRFEDDDYFNESAALRIEHGARDMQEKLTAAPNGWVMQYFCGTGVAQFEGFNLFARFENSNKVTFAGNHRFLRDGNANKYTEASSVYEMLMEDGLVLAFNVWNDVLTPFVDPVSYAYAPKSIVKDGEGMQGDHNFVVMSNADDEIILRGERHSAEVRLVKCDRSWEDYIADTETLKKSITNSSINDYYVVNADNDTLYFQGLRNGRFLYTDDLDKTKSVKVDSLPCVFTPYGFRIERSDSIGAYKFHEFKLADDKTCLKNEDGNVMVMARWDAFYLNFPKLYAIDQESLSDTQKALYKEIANEVKKANSSYTMTNISIGKSAGDVLGVVISYSYRSGGKRVTANAAVELNIGRTAYGQCLIEYKDTNIADANMTSFKNKSANEVEGKVRELAALLAGTYQMIPDDYFNPTSMTFQPINGGLSFKLN